MKSPVLRKAIITFSRNIFRKAGLAITLCFLLTSSLIYPSLASAQLGTIEPPPGVSDYEGFEEGGPTRLLSNIIKVLLVVAGLYAFFNILIAGYGFISAGGDPKKIQDAWSKIWQSLLGLTVAAGAFVLAALIGQIIFGDENALLQIRVFGP